MRDVGGGPVVEVVDTLAQLRASRDEWRRIAYVESQGNHCAWQHKAGRSQALLRRICDAQLAGDRDGLAAAVRDALELLREVR